MVLAWRLMDLFYQGLRLDAAFRFFSWFGDGGTMLITASFQCEDNSPVLFSCPGWPRLLRQDRHPVGLSPSQYESCLCSQSEIGSPISTDAA